MKQPPYKGKFPPPRILTAEEIERIIEGTKALLRHAYGYYGERMPEQPGLTYDDRHFRHTF
jgi:hypothetical protein